MISFMVRHSHFLIFSVWYLSFSVLATNDVIEQHLQKYEIACVNLFTVLITPSLETALSFCQYDRSDLTTVL
jgi:hypothetical protein